MKYFVVVSEDARSADVRRWIAIRSNQIWNYSNSKDLEFIFDPAGAEAILVVGGDGKMLNAIDKYHDLGLPFFGINRGTFGFLLNPIDNFGNFVRILSSPELHKTLELYLLRAEFFNENGILISRQYAFNDVYVKAKEGNQTITGEVVMLSEFSRKEVKKIFKGDGLIVAPPQGSTAYNHSAGGYVIPLEDKLLAVTSICSMNEPIKEVREMWRVDITVNRGTANGYVDRLKIENVKKVTIQRAHTVKLIFISGYNYQLKRYQLK